MLAKAFRPHRADGIGFFDEDCVDDRHVARRRDQIVVQILGMAGDIFLHQRHAETLGDAALDLPSGEKRVDHPPEIMRRGDADDLDLAKLQVDLDLGDLRAITIHGIRGPLAILV